MGATILRAWEVLLRRGVSESVSGWVNMRWVGFDFEVCTGTTDRGCG